MGKSKKIRDIVYGFVTLNEQECAIIDHPVFQRLRRIKQLSLTDMVYPGANHTRFEHSIGVLQMASDMFDSIIDKRQAFLETHLFLDESTIKVYRQRVRFAALLHDVGHAPFSHSAEDLMPLLPKAHPRYIEGKAERYSHEDYSIEIIKTVFRDIIERHDLIKAEDVTVLLGDRTVRPKAASLIWKDLISGQLDADRADYLLRDSKHLGVNYGLYDRDRLVKCMTIGELETGSPVLAIEEKGWHLAESLVIARYQMFSQVYFHRVRRIYDYHIYRATKCVLESKGLDGVYPPPTQLDNYLSFDDWTINAALHEKLGGKHGDIILTRNHFKCIDKTSDYPSEEEVQRIEVKAREYEAKGMEAYLDEASTSWYKLDKDISIEENDIAQPLSEKSSIVKAMNEKSRLQRLYVERT